MYYGTGTGWAKNTIKIAYWYVRGYCRVEFKRYFLFATRQHELLKYIHVLKLICAPWYTMNMPDFLVLETFVMLEPL